jgi:hypothetical protein
MSISLQKRLILSASLVLPSMLSIGSIATLMPTAALAGCDPTKNIKDCQYVAPQKIIAPAGCTNCSTSPLKGNWRVNPSSVTDSRIQPAQPPQIKIDKSKR